MPERTEEQIPKPDLGERVEEVLEAIDATCAELERQSRTAEENELAELEELADQAVGDDGKPVDVSEPEPDQTLQPESVAEPEALSEPEASVEAEPTVPDQVPPPPESVEDDGPADELDDEPPMTEAQVEPELVSEAAAEPAAPNPAVDASPASESPEPEDDSEDLGADLDDMLNAMDEVVASMEDIGAAPATSDAPATALEPESPTEPEQPEPIAESEPVVEPEAVAEMTPPEPESATEPEQFDQTEAASVDPVDEHPEPATDPTPEPQTINPDDVSGEDETSVAQEPIDEAEGLDASLDDELADLAGELGDELDEMASELDEATEEETSEAPAEEVDTVPEVDIPIEYDEIEDSSPEPEPEAVAAADQSDEPAESPDDEVEHPDADASGKDIETVLTDAVEEATAEHDNLEAEPETSEPANIEQLDEELAGLAEELVDGDFEDATGEVAEPVDIPEPVAADPVETEPDSLGDTTPIDEPTEPITARPGENEPEHKDDDDKPSGGKVVEPKPTDQPAWAKVRDTVLALARKGGKAAVPIGARIILLLGKPTSKLPASTRDTVGWLGLYTAFLAACVWGFLLFFRKPVMPEPTTETVGIAGEVVASNAPAEE